MKNLKPQSITIYIEETNVNFYGWQVIIDGFYHSKLLRKYIPRPLHVHLCHIQRGFGRSGTILEGWNKLGEFIHNKLNNQSISFKEIIKDHTELGERIFALYTEINQQDLSKAKESQFLRWLNKLWTDFMEINGVGLVPIGSDFYHNLLSNKLSEVLKIRNLSPEKRQEYLNLLMSPDKPNYPWYEQLDIMILTHKCKDLITLETNPAFINHLKKYEWLNYGYQGPQIKSIDFISRIKKLRQHLNLKKEINEHRSYFKDLVKKQRIVEKKLKFTNQEKYLFEAAREFTYLKGYRVDVRHYFHFISDAMFLELGKRYKLPLTWFQNAKRTEISDLLKGKKVSFKDALRRYDNVVWISDKNGTTFVKHDQIGKFTKKYYKHEEVIESEQVTGQTAFLGKVSGPVKIVNSVNHIAKVEHGDILVATTTNPDILPAMYRAIAFVTDSGGITSHAAIIAREMKKPCVIGTKFGTKVFRDGDMVEVDAIKGIVRKI